MRSVNAPAPELARAGGRLDVPDAGAAPVRTEPPVRQRPRDPPRMKRDPAQMKRDPPRMKRDPPRTKRDAAQMRLRPARATSQMRWVKRDPGRMRRDPPRVKRDPCRVKREVWRLKRRVSGLTAAPPTRCVESHCQPSPRSSGAGRCARSCRGPLPWLECVRRLGAGGGRHRPATRPPITCTKSGCTFGVKRLGGNGLENEGRMGGGGAESSDGAEC